MARIPLLDETDASLPEETRAALALARQTRGKLLNLYRALANRPAVIPALTALIQTVYRTNSTLEPRLGEFAYLTATAVNDCFY